MKDRIVIDGVTYVREESLNYGFKQPSQEALNELYRAMGESERCVYLPKGDYAEKANRTAKAYRPDNYGLILTYIIESSLKNTDIWDHIRTAIRQSFLDGIKWANKNVHYPDNWIIIEKPDQEAIDKANEVSEVYKNNTKRYFKYSGFIEGVNWQKNRKK